MFFASNLTFLREARGLDRGEVARATNLQPTTIGYFEQGQLEPRLEELIALADFFDQPVDRLLRRDLQVLPSHQDRKDFRLILLDVDGTLTQGGLSYTEKGDQLKTFHVRDSLAIHRAISRHGLQFAFISAGFTPGILHHHGRIIGVERIYTGRRPKMEVIADWLGELKLDLSQLAYVGDDLNDLPVVKAVGFSACPADAARQVRQAVDLVLQRRGGEGCVREFIEEVLGWDIEQ
jgi:3-deoxy-D-manno-octulosonate 8-phosphate phosphatase (KDO 8-P phosphatase)